jgi:hypothetical protein
MNRTYPLHTIDKVTGFSGNKKIHEIYCMVINGTEVDIPSRDELIELRDLINTVLADQGGHSKEGGENGEK